jgi:apolipoprotein N-acyltransferase
MLQDPRGITRNETLGTQRLAAEVAAGKRPKPAFVLWPENSSVLDVFYDAKVNQYITQAVHAIGVPVVVGAVVQQGDRYMLNQGIVWDPVTGPGDRYTKRHPVPFGEYIPLRGLLGDPSFGRLAMVPRDMVAGTRTTPLRVAGVRLGDAICFDVAYDEVMRDQVRNGAQLLAVQTSNATFILTHQVDQQFAITRLRAIEAGRWLVVASTNGLSGVIAPDGTVTQTAPRRTAAILEQTVGLSSSLTPAMRIGPWPGRAISALAVVALLCGAVTYRRSRGEETSPAGSRALRRVHRDAADRALRDHPGGELDRGPADDRPAGAGQHPRDVVDQA